jgi:hypothetical protein
MCSLLARRLSVISKKIRQVLLPEPKGKATAHHPFYAFSKQATYDKGIGGYVITFTRASTACKLFM